MSLRIINDLSLVLYLYILSVPNLAQTVYTKVQNKQVNPSGSNTNKSYCLVLSKEILSEQFEFKNATESYRNTLLDDEVKEMVPQGQLSEVLVKNQKIGNYFGNPLYEENGNTKYDNVLLQFSHPLKPEPKNTDKVLLKSNILKLIDGGPSSNRVDVVFMGDGYTNKERSKFFSDINRLVDETLATSTFSEFLPLLNVWSIFTPSADSGISYPQLPKNTTFGLYRPSAGSLRSIYIRKKNTARSVCRQIGPSGCDYPVVIANDEYYGGLGGEFAISTSSPTSGSIVLRHELGHNFGRVGEEYDGGEAYNGVNSASSLRNLGWRSWLTARGNLTNNANSSPREERMTYRIRSFPRNDLDKKTLTYIFRSNGRYTGGGWLLMVTLTGAPEQDSVQFLLDGQTLPWKSSGTKDKSFYSWTNTTHSLSNGRHNLTIAATGKWNTNPPLPHEILIARSLGSVFFYEFGNPEQFQSSNSVISAYPTWSTQGRKSYRPTNNGCLMRNMSHNQLCSVCKEGIWLQFLRRVSLIDDLFVIKNSDNSTTVNLKVIPLGQFRNMGNPVEEERLEIRWTMNGHEQLKLRDRLILEGIEGKGEWQVSVKLFTSRIRKDPTEVSLDKRKFSLK